MQVGMSPGETGSRRASVPSSKELRAPGSVRTQLHLQGRPCLPLAVKTSHLPGQTSCPAPTPGGQVALSPGVCTGVVTGLIQEVREEAESPVQGWGS